MNDLRDTFEAVHRPPLSSMIFATLRSPSPDVRTSASLIPVQDTYETARITSTLMGEGFSLCHETATIRSSSVGGVRMVSTLRATFHARSRVLGRAIKTEDTTDSADLSSAIDGYDSWTTRETARVVGRLVTNRVAHQDARSTGVVGDRSWWVTFADRRASGDVSSRSTLVFTPRNLSRDAAVVTSSATLRGLIRQVTREHAVVVSRATSVQTWVTTLRERAWLTSRVINDANHKAWTANVYNWAMSWYEGAPYTSMTSQFATAADGVYGRGTETVEAQITTGRMWFKERSNKGNTRFYIYSKNPLPLSLTVLSEGRGAPRTLNYELRARDSNEPEPYRCKLSQGAHGTHWTYTVANTLGGEFEIQRAELLMIARQLGNP